MLLWDLLILVAFISYYYLLSPFVIKDFPTTSCKVLIILPRLSPFVITFDYIIEQFYFKSNYVTSKYV
jgi:hypothetical protein